MNFIKRFTTTVSASLDNAVGKLENHDAIIEATIKQTKQSSARTKARINSLQRQLQTYESQLKEANQQHSLWAQRALSLADEDQAKALECLSRRNHCKASIERLTTRIEQQKNLIADVSENLKKLQHTLDEMSQKHNLMRSRQAVADVNRAVRHVSHNDSVNDTFERWESLVLEDEVYEESNFDPLDAEFSKIESDADLLQQLAELKAQHNE
ncbi:MAG: PspA/IM30 family protein [Gammaproteobacteria bacterium]|nr:PspA/IM30 family protein [Gammaproteobacteria bacterium]